MKLEDFKSGVYSHQYKYKQYTYKSFNPSSINHEWTWKDAKINTLLERAVMHLSELNAFAKFVPDIDIFISMHITKEANSSNRIEGTQTEMDDILAKEIDINPEKRDDWKEVWNYIKAMHFAIKMIEKIPLSNRLIKNVHEILLSGVRGKRKAPGKFRISQNWIGGTNLENAHFIPPHQNEVLNLMSDLEKFIHNDRINVPFLIKIALIHYQFETIHPFLDGNGRTGRLLITLYLMYFDILEKPVLYLSDFFAKNKGAYYDSLTVVRASNNLVQWVKFFLVGIIETSQKSKETLQNILKLKDKINDKIVILGNKAKNAQSVINYLYSHPIADVEALQKHLVVSYKVANDLVKDLLKLNILKEITGNKRNRLFKFVEYINLFENGK